MNTADLCDQLADARVCIAPWQSYGGRSAFRGYVHTVRTFEDAGLIRQMLETKGQGRVLVVDGGGSVRRAILGDRLAVLGARNGWAGVLIHGAIRDREALRDLNVGVLALGCVPVRGGGEGTGEVDVDLDLCGVTIRVGEYITIDPDGVVVTPHAP